MAYRADIFIKAKKEHEPKLNSIILSGDYNNSFQKVSDEEYVYYYADRAKWYYAHPSARAIIEYIEEHNQDDSREQTISLIEIGEDGTTEQVNIMDDFYPTYGVDGFIESDGFIPLRTENVRAS